MQAVLLRPKLRANRAAASQLGPAFNFGGLSANARTTCDPSDTATNAILRATAVIVILHLRRAAWQFSGVGVEFSCCSWPGRHRGRVGAAAFFGQGRVARKR